MSKLIISITIIYTYNYNLQVYTVNLMLPYLTLFGALFDCLNPVIKNIMIITIYIYIPFFLSYYSPRIYLCSTIVLIIIIFM